MIYFYYGDNIYSLEAKLAIFKERYLAQYESGLNLVELDFAHNNLDDFVRSVEAHPMFEEKKLVLVRGASGLSVAAWDDLAHTLERHKIAQSDDVVVVFYEKKLEEELTKKAGKKRFSYLHKHATTEAFVAPSGSALTQWLRRQAKKNNIALPADAARMLTERVGGDTVRLMNEIKKLALFSNGEPITPAMVKALVTGVVETDIFSTVDALAQKNTAAALAALAEHWAAGDDPLQLMGMFAYELRVLVLIKEAQEAGGDMAALRKNFGLHPYVIKKNSRFARNFSLAELAALYGHLAAADSAIKTGKQDGREALEDFVLAATRQTKNRHRGGRAR